MKRGSLGLIETWGYTPAVEAVDTGMKTANVSLLACELTRPALMTVAFTGDVAAVRTAVEAGAAAAARVGRVVSTHVIARPDASLIDRFSPSSPPSPPPTSQLAGQGKTKVGRAKSKAKKADRPPIPDDKRASSVKATPFSEPKKEATEKSNTTDGDEKKHPSSPPPGDGAAIEMRPKKQIALRSKPAAANQPVPEKKPKRTAKSKALKKKPPSKAPE